MRKGLCLFFFLGVLACKALKVCNGPFLREDRSLDEEESVGTTALGRKRDREDDDIACNADMLAPLLALPLTKSAPLFSKNNL
jgi:hypothetical protein